jgi:glycosyltransferase involved in cell wall biosynthesis
MDAMSTPQVLAEKPTSPPVENCARQQDHEQQITARYLLMMMCNPCYVNSSGTRYLDQLWADDLVLHTTYIKDLTLAAPRIDGDPPPSFVRWDSLPLLKNVRVVDLPPIVDFQTAVLRLPRLLGSLWAAMRRADVIHTGVSGWPMPEGWMTVPLAKLRRLFIIVVVESDFWRITAGQPVSLKRRCRAAVFEVLNRWCVNQAQVAFFTHESYLRTLLTRHRERGHLFQASWLDETNICSDSEARSLWARKVQTEKLRLVFVGRLIPEKGIMALFEALGSLRVPKGRIRCDIVGDGPLLDQCKYSAEGLKDRLEVNFVGRIDYGSPLFNLLAEQDALVIPSLSDEQPRVVYDAYARAIPALGFKTDGLESCIKDGVTGRLCERANVAALANLIDWAVCNGPRLAEMGMAGLSVARSLTHCEMHRRRCEVLSPMIADHLSRGMRGDRKCK